MVSYNCAPDMSLPSLAVTIPTPRTRPGVAPWVPGHLRTISPGLMLAEARFTGPEVTGALEVDGHGATARVARPTMWGAASLAVKQGWNKNRSQLSTWNPACSIASAVWRVRWQPPANHD